MGLISRLLGGSSDPDPDPEPRPEPEEREKTFGIYRANLVYEDGSTETVEFYKKRHKDARYEFLQGFRDSSLGGVRATDAEKVPYSVLARPPEVERVGTARVSYTYDPAEEDPHMFESGREITNVSESYEGEL